MLPTPSTDSAMHSMIHDTTPRAKIGLKRTPRQYTSSRGPNKAKHWPTIPTKSGCRLCRVTYSVTGNKQPGSLWVESVSTGQDRYLLDKVILADSTLLRGPGTFVRPARREYTKRRRTTEVTDGDLSFRLSKKVDGLRKIRRVPENKSVPESGGEGIGRWRTAVRGPALPYPPELKPTT